MKNNFCFGDLFPRSVLSSCKISETSSVGFIIGSVAVVLVEI